MNSKNKASEKSVVIMPESEGNTICCEFKGLITLEDHDILHSKVMEVVAKYGHFNLLF